MGMETGSIPRGWKRSLVLVGCMRNKASARARASASAKNLIFWSHVKKRPLALALALPKTSERGPLALALPLLGLTDDDLFKTDT